MADNRGPQGLLTLVCLTCGKEQFFDTQPPADVVCERCGSTVFRTFFTPTEPDEATLANLEDSSRSIALGDESSNISPDELRDLNNP